MPEIHPMSWLRLVILGLLWGASFMFVSIALTGVGPLVLVATRLSLGAIFLVILSCVMGSGLSARRGPNAARIWLFALVMALCSNAAPFALLSWSQQVVASGFAGVCMAAVPLFVLPLAHVFVPGEKLTLRRLIGFVTGTIGVVVLIGPSAFASTGNDMEILAKIACVGAASCYAIGSIFTRLCPEVDRLALATAVLLLASLIFTPYALYIEGIPNTLNTKSLFALLYLGILPTGVAQIFLVMVIRDAGPVFMSLVNYQIPIWSIVFGTMILAEPIPPSLVLGLLMILSGVALSQLGALRRLFERA